MTEWQSIETAPKDRTWFLGFWPAVSAFEDQFIVTRWCDDDSFNEEPYWLDAADRMDWTQPTHWMPLPETPKP